MKKEFTPEVVVGDELNVEFLRNSGKRPVCRINGKVGFIDRTYTGFIAPGSSWMVKVLEIKPNFVQVLPLIETHKAKENHQAYFQKLEKLKSEKGMALSATDRKNKFCTKFIL